MPVEQSGSVPLPPALQTARGVKCTKGSARRDSSTQEGIGRRGMGVVSTL